MWEWGLDRETALVIAAALISGTSHFKTNIPEWPPYTRGSCGQEIQHIPTSKNISSYLRLYMCALPEEKKSEMIINQLMEGLGLLMDELLLVPVEQRARLLRFG